jgi:3-oxoacyl-[acyl-carrier protein] reductase
MPESTGRVAIVTGAAKGIGSGITLALLEAGNRVLMMDTDEGALDEFHKDHSELAGRFSSCAADISDVDDWARAVAQAQTEFGRVGILVNNAAISPKRNGTRVPSAEIDLDEWNRVLAVNLTGAFIGFQAVVDDMRAAHWGRIVNISSTAGRNGARLAGIHYGVAKTGILGLTRTLAFDHGADGITVNAVAPGRIMTPMAAQVSDEVNAALLARIPVGRFGYPDDIGALVRFLVSNEAGFITGATIDANGGAYMG